MTPRTLHPPRRRARAIALALALLAAGLAPAAASTLFNLKPEETSVAVLRAGEASPTEVAARVVILEGVFPPGREVRIWASERIEFRPGFGARDAKISWHVGPAPAANGLAKEARNVALPTDFSAQATASQGNLLLHYALPRGERLSVRVVTTSGKTVFARDLGPRAAGRHSESLSLPGLKAGMYVVRVISGKNVLSKRMRLGAR
jgi:hypothetical protein